MTRLFNFATQWVFPTFLYAVSYWIYTTGIVGEKSLEDTLRFLLFTGIIIFASAFQRAAHDHPLRTERRF